METKKCRKCFETKEIFEFRKVKDRYRNECKECYNLYNRDYNKSEKRKEYLKSEKRREYTKEYMKIYEKCDKRKGYWKMYECTKERKEYRTKYNRFYRKKRKEEDPLFRLSISIRNRISESIYRMGYTKNSKTYKILGCDFKDFKFYIESKFVDNMSWDNYGRDMSGWQLDHIIPISSAKSEKEVIELNHYSNFQPLWAIDNIKKSNKLTYLT